MSWAEMVSCRSPSGESKACGDETHQVCLLVDRVNVCLEAEVTPASVPPYWFIKTSLRSVRRGNVNRREKDGLRETGGPGRAHVCLFLWRLLNLKSSAHLGMGPVSTCSYEA